VKIYVVDSSVAVKWYIPEDLSEKAASFLAASKDQQYRLLAPDLVYSEIGNVLWKKCRRADLEAGDARKILAVVGQSFPVQAVDSKQLLPPAFEIAHAFDRSIYDSLYLTLAKVSEGIMITADELLVNALHNTILGNLVLYLGDWSLGSL
jgi:predicted nucleic acid-binding protein